jgi:thiosulfate reductase cytochrome b subunit
VAGGEWAIRDCQTCHSDESALAADYPLASYLPGGVLPEFVDSDDVAGSGSLILDVDGGLSYRPDPAEDGYYVLGHNSVSWVDWFGVGAFLLTILGVVSHGGRRIMAARKLPQAQGQTRRTYMYGVYERLWHWLQSFVILLLLLTGLVIHKPAMFGFLSFHGVVLMHNILAGILVVNAALALFYHLASGEIKQYIPRPAGFFSQAVEQAVYYTRGIFLGAAHPFEKTPERKLNPLQQVTYFGLLNVLLPLQVLTGIAMWGAQRWPQLTERLGGLPFLGPFHTLIAWLLASFVVMHVYLTTTAGEKPLSGIQSMMMGWEDLEVHTPTDHRDEESP